MDSQPGVYNKASTLYIGSNTALIFGKGVSLKKVDEQGDFEAVKFFESLLVKDENELYYTRESTGYEGWFKLKDGLTDLV